MKLLLLLNSPPYLRPFADTMQTLADRGHTIAIGWHSPSAKGPVAAVDQLAAHPNITFIPVPVKRSEQRYAVNLLRRTRNYVRYLETPFRGAGKLRRRAFDRLLRGALADDTVVDSALSDSGLALPVSDVARIKEALAWMETLIPPDPACTALVADGGYDAVLVSSLVALNSSTQVEVVKAARNLGVPVGLLVYSWDNLSTKGEIHAMPDKVFTWNQRQRDEATTLHNVPAARVVVAGAPRFDEFLACAPQVSRERFFGTMGLDPTRPALIYLCSSAFVSGDEIPFITRWLQALRTAPSEDVRHCSVIVRPHPDVALIGKDLPGTKLDLGVDDLAATAFRPFDDPGAVVVRTASRTPQGLYECLWHSDAVVGLNTSAEIEAGLLGRPVFSVLAGSAADGQQSTLHFHYLLREQGGFVDVAESFEQHVQQVHALLALPPDEREARRRTVAERAIEFVRPLGADVPVATALADAIEREMRKPAPPTPA